MTPILVSPNAIRQRFSQAMSVMYRAEVPLYGDLLTLVEDINQHTLQQSPPLLDQLVRNDNLQRLSEERHGAIRLGTAQELSTMRRLFAVMGMQPVGYYDLTIANIPVHSTAFRPLAAADLAVNPFRVFTSLLRLDLIQDLVLREQIEQLLSQRQIFTSETLVLIEQAEQQGGLTEEQAERFVAEALETFRWHEQAQVDYTTYQQLHDTHRLIADIASFKGPHINHLTPRTLDIDAAQQAMQERNMKPKAIIEGPPRRQHAILLRQTSFTALEESVYFKVLANQATKKGVHTARFGEIEQRGVALTPKGRELYDQLLDQVRTQAHAASPSEYQHILQQVFQQFPDDLAQMRKQGLAYFAYSVQEDALMQYQGEYELEALIDNGVVQYTPLTYEDFLPVSAAGIFQSNLGESSKADFMASANQQAFEQALGCAVVDAFAWYAHIEQATLRQVKEKIATLKSA